MNNIGRTIKDFYCNGFFGRDFGLAGSRIEAEGYDWIVIRDEREKAHFADFAEGWQRRDKQKLIDEWCNAQNEEE